ncbi:MAG: hypothetical protein IJ362_05725 [Oscillospiraceae bacterium]|nr:hypothetical protein [Oscillospiraceae bacterium]
MKKILILMLITACLLSACSSTQIEQSSSSAVQSQQADTPLYTIESSLGSKAVKSIVKMAEKADMQSFVHPDELYLFDNKGITLSPSVTKITDNEIIIELDIKNNKTEISLDLTCPLNYSYPVSQKDNITDISNLQIYYPSVTISGNVMIVSSFDRIMIYDADTLEKISDDININSAVDGEDGVFLCSTVYGDGFVAVYSSAAEEGLAVFDKDNNLKNKFTAGYKNMLLHRNNLSDSAVENNQNFSIYGQRKIKCSDNFVCFEIGDAFIADLKENKIYKAYPLFSHSYDNKNVTVYSTTDIYGIHDKCYVICEENDAVTDTFYFDGRRMSSEFAQSDDALTINGNGTKFSAVCSKTGMTLDIDTEKHKAVIFYNITQDMLKGYETAAISPDGNYTLKYNVSMYTPTRTVLCNNKTGECFFICNGTAYEAGFNPDGTIFARTATDYIITDYKGNWLYSMAERLPYNDVSKGQSIYLCDVHRKQDGSYLAVFFETGLSCESLNYRLAVLDNNGNLTKIIDTGKAIETYKSFYISPEIEIMDYNTIKLTGGDREYAANYFEILVELSTDYCEIIH